MPDQVRINGNMHSWASCIFKVAGEAVSGLTSIDFADKIERVKGYGMARHQAPRGRTAGKYTVDPLKIVFTTDTAEYVRGLLANLGATTSLGTVSVQMVLQYVEAGNAPITIEFDDCKIAGIATTSEEGAEPGKENWEWDIMRIRRNGRSLYDTSRGAP